MLNVLLRLRQTLVHYVFERRYNLNTEECEHLEDYGVSGENGDRVPYVPSGWLDFGKIAQIAKFSQDDVFVDFGSGKGRMVFLAAARHKFKKVIGVELLNEWNEIARSNIANNVKRLKCEDVTLVTSDVLAFKIPTDMTVAYFFEPFGTRIFSAVMKNIQASIASNPRKLLVIYQSGDRKGRPKLTEVLDQCDWLKLDCKKDGKLRGYDFYFYRSLSR